MKRVIGLAAGAACVAVLVGCGQSNTATNQPKSSTQGADAQALADADAASKAADRAAASAKAALADSSLPTEQRSGWSYDSSTDEMRGTTMQIARIESENTIHVGFPYDDGAARLTLRHRQSDGLSVMLHAPGQFICHSFNEGTVAVKFDTGPVEHYRCDEPSDATTGMIFIGSEKKFVAKLKAAKRVIIEAEFFQSGPKQMKFDVEGLTWPPKAG